MAFRALLFAPCLPLYALAFVAKFALTELRSLSDSGVYETLELENIVSAATQV